MIWKERTWYLVDVSYSEFNPIHRALFFTGFLHDGKPGGYNMITSSCYARPFSYREAYYLKVIREIVSSEEFKSSGELPKEPMK